MLSWAIPYPLKHFFVFLYLVNTCSFVYVAFILPLYTCFLTAVVTEEQKPAGFVCRCCKKCTVKAFYSKDGCLQAAQQDGTESFFPYLHHSNLSEKERILLESRLMDDTNEIIRQYASTEKALIASLESQNLEVSQLRNYVANFVPKLGTRQVELETLQKAKNLYDVFFALKPSQSFFRYEVIESIVQDFGNDSDRQLMAGYISKFKNFCERSVFEVPISIFHDSDLKPGDKVFCVKFTPDQNEHISLGNVVAVRAKIAAILDIDVVALKLCCISDGCVCLWFMIPAHMADKIFPLSVSQISALSENQIKLVDGPNLVENKDMSR